MKLRAILALLLLASPAAAATTRAPNVSLTQSREATTGVAFRLRGYHTESKVALAGSFNNWQPAEGALARDGDFLWLMNLKPGRYAYKFVIDGRWITDPYNLDAEDDGQGNVNSVLVVTAGRFDLDPHPLIAPLAPKFEALRQELQRDLVARSPRGRQVVAQKSGHMIQLDEPELVVESVRRVVVEASAPRARRR